MRYTPTDSNMADLFTKPLTIAIFERLVKAALGSKGAGWIRGSEDVAAVTSAEIFMLTNA